MERAAKPLLRALSGEPVWPPPIWLMRQAGRYLPEYRAVRASVADFIALCTTPDSATDAPFAAVGSSSAPITAATAASATNGQK